MHGLKRILRRLGLKQSEFAKLLDVSPRTVSLWATQDVALPGPVKAYLRMLQTVDPATKAAELARLRGPRTTFADGLYSLTFSTAKPSTEMPSQRSAVAMLRAGRIIGSDAEGGKFEGTYRFDTARQTNHFHVWLRVPPTGRLITGGDMGEDGAVVEVTAEVDKADPLTSTVVQVAGQPLGVTFAYLGPIAG